MAIVTAGDMIALALKTAGVLGVGQTALAEDSNDALTALQGMIGSWNRRRWLIPHELDVYFQSTGALSYTVGTGGNFNCPRPTKLMSAFIRLSPGTSGQPSAQSVDYPLEIVQARENYNDIAVKGIGTFPLYAFYDATYPLGNVYFWPIPASTFELHIAVMDQLTSLPTLKTALNLSPEYQDAILYSLAQRLRVIYQMPPDERLDELAAECLQTIRNANMQVPRLRLPDNLRSSGRYNIYSDTA